MSIILGNLENVGLGQANMLHSLEQLLENNVEQGSFVMEATEGNVKILEKRGYEFFIPSSLLKYVNEDSNAKVYFDLECHSFFQKMKEVIEKGSKTNGVFRSRRMIKEDNLEVMADDLYVLSLLFGEPKDKHIKRSKRNDTSHIILMIRFDSGVMAHVEFTVANAERIEMEWSGMRQIVEFDSDELKGHLLPLQHETKILLASAKRINAEVIDKVRFYKNLIAGGTLI